MVNVGKYILYTSPMDPMGLGRVSKVGRLFSFRPPKKEMVGPWVRVVMSKGYAILAYLNDE